MSSSIYKIKSPANGSVLGEIEYFQEKDIPVYVDKARKALRSWRHSVPHERAKILKKASRKLISIKKELEIFAIDYPDSGEEEQREFVTKINNS